MASVWQSIFRRGVEERARIGKFDSQTIAREMGITYRNNVTSPLSRPSDPSLFRYLILYT